MLRLSGLYLALFSVMASAVPGFFPLDHKNVPDAVRKKADAVYEIIVVKKASKLHRDLSFESCEDILKDLDKTEAGGIRLAYCQRKLAHCKDTGAKSCFFDGDDVWTGTAFFAESTSRLFTAEHLLADALGEVKKGEVKEVGLLLRDRKGRFVFDSALGKDKAVVKFHLGQTHVPKDSKASFDKKLQAIGKDLAVVDLGRKVSEEFFRIAEKKNGAVVGDDIFQLGFPSAATSREDAHKAPDGKPNTLSVTLGKVISGVDAMKKIDFELETKALDEVLEHANFGDNDTINGMSGGPLILKNGQLTGVVGGSIQKPKAIPRDYPDFSVCVPVARLVEANEQAGK